MTTNTPDRTAQAARWLSGAALALLAALVAVWVWQAPLYGRLLRLAPDAPVDRSLLAYAERRARPLYREHCAVCHGADMKGDRRTGIPDLTDRDWLYGEGRVTEIEQTILYGIRSGHHRGHDLADMPAFGTARPYRRYLLPTLDAGQIGDLADYLLSLQRRSGDRAAAARGGALFSGAPQCYDCHTSDAGGDNFVGASNLTDKIWLYGNGSRADIIRSISGGRAGTCPAWTGRLGAADIKALAVYINAVSHGGPV